MQDGAWELLLNTSFFNCKREYAIPCISEGVSEFVLCLKQPICLGDSAAGKIDKGVVNPVSDMKTQRPEQCHTCQ